jgi:hypothetical protein
MEKTLDKLRSFAEGCTSSMSGLPHAKKVTDRTAAAALIVFCEEQLRKLTKMSDEEHEKLSGYIHAMPDSTMRLIMGMRYLSGFTWERIAYLMGGGNSADALRMMHNRYLDREAGS